VEGRSFVLVQVLNGVFVCGCCMPALIEDTWCTDTANPLCDPAKPIFYSSDSRGPEPLSDGTSVPKTHCIPFGLAEKFQETAANS
jgi:hypothetical protein